MPRRAFGALLALLLLSLGGCSDSGGSAAPVAPDDPPPDPLPSTFVEVTLDAGLDYSHGYFYIFNDLILMAGGVAVGDYDNDGWLDLYVVLGDLGPNMLFRNKGDGTFEEVGAAAGVDLYFQRGCGPTFADFNGDGWLDIFIGGVDGTLPSAFENNQDGTFTNVTGTCGVDLDADWGTFSVTFGDYDKDLDVDLFLTHWGADYADGSTPMHLWQNQGDGTFSHVPLPALLDSTIDHTFTANFADIDGDTWPDLLVAADFRKSKVLLNKKDGSFEDITNLVISDENGMGAGVADYDHDGDLDWFVSSIYSDTLQPQGLWGTSGNRLYRNLGDGTFEDVTDEAGVREGGWGWGATFADFDNDGHPDILHVNGFEFPHVNTDIVDEYLEDPTRLFMSNGDGTFTERAVELGIDDRGQGRGVAAFDFDRDGDLDIFIANDGQPPKLYRNDLITGNHFLNVKLVGLAPNTQAIGARVSITIAGNKRFQSVCAGNNYVSQNPAELHFGLGAETTIEELRVEWPDGMVTVLNNVAGDQFLVIQQ